MTRHPVYLRQQTTGSIDLSSMALNVTPNKENLRAKLRMQALQYAALENVVDNLEQKVRDLRASAALTDGLNMDLTAELEQLKSAYKELNNKKTKEDFVDTTCKISQISMSTTGYETKNEEY
eukprot:CAMPEP_0182436738 /NCGR_PEP_ID=MMETSP1167-20130531/83280_1 /TAXON_ID=2988 /ORGANISM="Mallomonas Sp, Strain CCMP3275" /LENGTH=121 /DNA_ID=CAMNT_0024629213 /DNA_START=192 /DNA_END=554 /DNA_ORIENTATION=+